jgi:hypothetical protein
VVVSRNGGGDGGGVCGGDDSGGGSHVHQLDITLTFAFLFSSLLST